MSRRTRCDGVVRCAVQDMATALVRHRDLAHAKPGVSSEHLTASTLDLCRLLKVSGNGSAFACLACCAGASFQRCVALRMGKAGPLPCCGSLTACSQHAADMC